MLENDAIFIKIAEALLVDYSSIYYVNAVTNEYQWYSADPDFHSLHIEQHGSDFFKNLIVDSDKVIYEVVSKDFRDIEKIFEKYNGKINVSFKNKEVFNI